MNSRSMSSLSKTSTLQSGGPHIVCIGGGTGTFVALSGLKLHTKHLSAIVTMSDSGGSNKRIRDEFGLLPTSDIRQCLVALADEKPGRMGLLRQLFMYRFERGQGISGMTFGNLFMAALSDVLGSQKEAIRQTGKVLRIHGNVIPVSFTDTNLFAKYENGLVVSEEHLIDEPEHDGTLKIAKVYLQPEAEPNIDALDAIKNADIVVLGPGDLYTSILPNIVVSGIPEALQETKAKKVYVMNLMTKYGQTYGYTAQDHLDALQNYIGTSVDAVIVNNGPLFPDAVDMYAQSHEFPVVDNLKSKKLLIIRQNVVSDFLVEKSKSDTLVRSLIRHDSEKLARAIMEVAEAGVV